MTRRGISAEFKIAAVLAFASCTPARGDVPAKLSPVDALCATKGAAPLGSRVEAPTVRAVAPTTSGDAASLSFVYRGATPSTRALAAGQERRQLGLKLRAANSCNVLYVMRRLDPLPGIEVSLKINAGAATHADCGASGYRKVAPASSAAPPPLAAGTSHVLRAELSGDDLVAWVDDAVVWRGSLPATARALRGPAGLRSDNVSFDLVAFAVAPLPSTSSPACHRDDAD